MSQLDELNRVVREAIKTGQIGQPVFVRCIATIAPKRDALGTIARLVQAAGAWIGSPARRLYGIESTAPAQRSVGVAFANGASALVSTATAGPSGPTIDLIVLGNHGALYHETLAASGAGNAEPTNGARASADPALEAAIDAAVRSGRPQVLPVKEGP